MKKLAILFTAIAVTAGCGSIKPIRINTHDGSIRYFLECGNDKTACIIKANEICPSGYSIVNEHSHSEVSVGPWGGGSEMQYGLEIQCKQP